MSHDAKTAILGAGLAGLACAHFYGKPVTLYERATSPGGLCRSFPSGNGVQVDCGPHIFFSKDKEALDFLKSLTPMKSHRRANAIWHHDRFVRYPFENDLGALEEDEKIAALEDFVHNPHEDAPADNMRMFFYKTFGEAMSLLYLLPYNRKIWKRDTEFLDTQMVSRIPKPPEEHIIASVAGKFHEGYTHQLNFWYPEHGGTEAIINGLISKTPNAEILTDNAVRAVFLEDGKFRVVSQVEERTYDRLISTIPLPELLDRIYPQPPVNVQEAVSDLQYLSLSVTVVVASKDSLGDRFAVTIADPKVPFHRVTKLNFLGGEYDPGDTVLLIEETFRPEEAHSSESDTLSSLAEAGFVHKKDVQFTRNFTVEYAYVVYDTEHRKNVDTILKWLDSKGIETTGRFGKWEYWNTDKIVMDAKTVMTTRNRE